MSRVFVATETALAREIVIKIMSPEAAAGVSVERFRREILLAAQLQHPHIVPLLAAGDVEGLPYFTMPLVRGESLRTRVARDGALPLADLVRILRDVASALSYAHERGVVHRDIKPDNVLIARGDAMVTDFGVAKALSDSSNAPPSGGALTSAGVSLGTPAYMAPEQVAADPDMDHRVDIYAFGVMAYELLAGTTPFAGRTMAKILVAHLTEVPSPIGERRLDAPPALAELVRRCLAKDPSDRPQTADEIVAALDPDTISLPVPSGVRAAVHPFTSTATGAPTTNALGASRWMIALAATAALVIGGLLWRGRSTESASSGGPVRLAVLPFDNLGDSADAYFADGVTDAVRNKLSVLPGIEVIASASSGEYRHSSKPPAQIGRELNVAYLLVGKVRWARGAGGVQSRVQVSPELVDAHSAAQKWGQAFDAPLTDVFQVQGEIAGQVVEALGGALNAGTRRELAARPTDNLAAYDAFLQGEAAAQRLSNVQAVALHRAVAFYEKAVLLDSTFALAWAQLARAEGLLYFQGSISGDPHRASQRAVERAKALAPGRAETYLASGDYDQYIVQDNARALAAYTAGLAVAPSNTELLTQSALAEQSLGRWEAALGHFRQATTNDPRSVSAARRLAQTYLWLRRYPAAEDEANRALSLAPTNLDALETRAMVAIAQGKLAEAQALVRTTPTGVAPDEFIAFIATFWNLYWLLDDAQLDRVLQLSAAPFGGEPGVHATVFAEIYYARGDTARARIYGDSAAIVYAAALRSNPQADADTHVEYAQALIYSGRKAEAVREAERAVAMQGIEADAYSGAYNEEVLARIYTMAGQPEKAIDHLERLLKVPFLISPAWLMIDPRFAPLKGNPRFEALIHPKA